MGFSANSYSVKEDYNARLSRSFVGCFDLSGTWLSGRQEEEADYQVEQGSEEWGGVQSRGRV